MRVLVAFVLMTVLVACGGRSAQPVASVRATDEALTCDHIKAEGEVNLERIEGLVGEGELATAQNVGFLLAAPIISLPLFLDLGSAEKDEIKALETRNQRLAELGSAKGCDLSS